MRDGAFSDIVSINDVFPGVKVEVEDSLLLGDVVFLDFLSRAWYSRIYLLR